MAGAGNGGTTAPALPEQVVRRSITDAQWRTLSKNLFPGANPNSVLMVWDYCIARKLDPLKKPCHIVPMEVKDAATNRYEWRDVVMPGIYEYRTTAQRTGEYLGHAKPEYGAEYPWAGVTAPEYCDFTVYRWNGAAGQKVEFPVRVYFREVVATKKDGSANARWSKAPIQMLTKCAEAAALREAFPDELGGEQTAEEMDGQRAIEAQVTDVRQVLAKPDKYDDWLTDMQTIANDGDLPKLEATWAESNEALRTYLTTTDPGYWESLKARTSGRLLE